VVERRSTLQSAGRACNGIHGIVCAPWVRIVAALKMPTAQQPGRRPVDLRVPNNWYQAAQLAAHQSSSGDTLTVMGPE
jgi:hypothetical protein